MNVVFVHSVTHLLVCFVLPLQLRRSSSPPPAHPTSKADWDALLAAPVTSPIRSLVSPGGV